VCGRVVKSVRRARPVGAIHAGDPLKRKGTLNSGQVAAAPTEIPSGAIRRASSPYNSAPCVALSPGTRVGAYEILTPLGGGGTGEVYRAKDTKLGREVALKILPATLMNAPDRVARFRDSVVSHHSCFASRKSLSEEEAFL